MDKHQLHRESLYPFPVNSSATNSRESDATTLRRQLFLTPTPVGASSSSSSFNSDYHNQNHHHQTPLRSLVGTSLASPSGHHHPGRFSGTGAAPTDPYQWKTPQPSRGKTVSTRRRPSHAHVEPVHTPSVPRRAVRTNPEASQMRQSVALGTWLNHELLHPLHPRTLDYDYHNLNNKNKRNPHHPHYVQQHPHVFHANQRPVRSEFPYFRLSDDAMFLRMLMQMHDLLNSESMGMLKERLASDLCEFNISFKPDIDLQRNSVSRTNLVNLILNNYHPAWLLPGLSVLFSCNLVSDLDVALYMGRATADDDGSQYLGGSGDMSTKQDQVVMQFLRDTLLTTIMSPHVLVYSRLPHEFDVPSSSSSSPVAGQAKYHRLVLQRIFELIFLLDVAKVSGQVNMHADPPLFRPDALVRSSSHFVSQLGIDFITDGTNILKMFQLRGFQLSYETPACEVRRSMYLANLLEDIRDGIRLCKIASLVSGDQKLLHYVKVPSGKDTQAKVREMQLFNVEMAMRSMMKYSMRNLTQRFQWECLPGDIVSGNTDQILAFMWQVVAVWRDAKLLKPDDLSKELELVEDNFRQTKRDKPRLSQSPTDDMTLSEISPSVVSPNSLSICGFSENVQSELLLKWAAVVCGTYGLAVSDMTENFRDGAALCVLLHHYYPHVVDLGDIMRANAIEMHLSDKQYEAELSIARRNFELFSNHVRRFGNFPPIPIFAEAGVGLPFAATEKQMSFGRPIDLTLSYLFALLVMQKGSVDLKGQYDLMVREIRQKAVFDQASRVIAGALKYVSAKERMEAIEASPRSAKTFSPSPSNRLSPGRGLASPGRPFAMNKRVNEFSASNSSSSKKKKHPPRSPFSGLTSYEEYIRNKSPTLPLSASTSVMNTDIPRVPPAFADPEQMSPLHKIVRSANLNSPVNKRTREKITMRVSQSPRKKISFLVPSSVDESRKKWAVDVISNHYSCYKTRQVLKQRNECAILLQACARGYLARKEFMEQVEALKNSEAVFENALKSRDESAPGSPASIDDDSDPVASTIQLTMSILPQVQDHMQALDRYARRMVAHENADRMAKAGYTGAPAPRNETATSPQKISLGPNQVEIDGSGDLGRARNSTTEPGHSNSPQSSDVSATSDSTKTDEVRRPTDQVDANGDSISRHQQTNAAVVQHQTDPGEAQTTSQVQENRHGYGFWSKFKWFSGGVAKRILTGNSENAHQVGDALTVASDAMAASESAQALQTKMDNLQEQIVDIATSRNAAPRRHRAAPRPVLAVSRGNLTGEDNDNDGANNDDEDQQQPQLVNNANSEESRTGVDVPPSSPAADDAQVQAHRIEVEERLANAEHAFNVEVSTLNSVRRKRSKFDSYLRDLEMSARRGKVVMQADLENVEKELRNASNIHRTCVEAEERVSEIGLHCAMDDIESDGSENRICSPPSESDAVDPELFVDIQKQQLSDRLAVASDIFEKHREDSFLRQCDNLVSRKNIELALRESDDKARLEKSEYGKDMAAIDEHIRITEEAVESIRVHIPQTPAKSISDSQSDNNMEVETDFILSPVHDTPNRELMVEISKERMCDRLEGAIENFERHQEESFLHKCDDLVSRKTTQIKLQENEEKACIEEVKYSVEMAAVEEEERSAQAVVESIRVDLPRTPTNSLSDSNSDDRIENDFEFNVSDMNPEPDACSIDEPAVDQMFDDVKGRRMSDLLADASENFDQHQQEHALLRVGEYVSRKNASLALREASESSHEAEALHSAGIEAMDDELETTKTVFEAAMDDIPSSPEGHAEENCDIHFEDVEESPIPAEEDRSSLDNPAFEQMFDDVKGRRMSDLLADASENFDQHQQEHALLRVGEYVSRKNASLALREASESSHEAEALHSAGIEAMDDELETTKTVFEAAMDDIPSSPEGHAEENCDIHFEDVEESPIPAEEDRSSLDNPAFEQMFDDVKGRRMSDLLADASENFDQHQQEHALLRVGEYVSRKNASITLHEMSQSSHEAEALHSAGIEAMDDELETTKALFEAAMDDIPSSPEGHSEENCDIHFEDVEESPTSAEDDGCSLDNPAFEQMFDDVKGRRMSDLLADASENFDQHQQEHALLRVGEYLSRKNASLALREASESSHEAETLHSAEINDVDKDLGTTKTMFESAMDNIPSSPDVHAEENCGILYEEVKERATSDDENLDALFTSTSATSSEALWSHRVKDLLHEGEQNFDECIQCLWITRVDQSMRRKNIVLSLEELSVEEETARYTINQDVIAIENDLHRDAKLYDEYRIIQCYDASISVFDDVCETRESDNLDDCEEMFFAAQHCLEELEKNIGQLCKERDSLNQELAITEQMLEAIEEEIELLDLVVSRALLKGLLQQAELCYDECMGSAWLRCADQSRCRSGIRMALEELDLEGVTARKTIDEDLVAIEHKLEEDAEWYSQNCIIATEAVSDDMIDKIMAESAVVNDEQNYCEDIYSAAQHELEELEKNMTRLCNECHIVNEELSIAKHELEAIGEEVEWLDSWLIGDKEFIETEPVEPERMLPSYGRDYHLDAGVAGSPNPSIGFFSGLERQEAPVIVDNVRKTDTSKSKLDQVEEISVLRQQSKILSERFPLQDVSVDHKVESTPSRTHRPHFVSEEYAPLFSSGPADRKEEEEEEFVSLSSFASRPSSSGQSSRRRTTSDHHSPATMLRMQASQRSTTGGQANDSKSSSLWAIGQSPLPNGYVTLGRLSEELDALRMQMSPSNASDLLLYDTGSINKLKGVMRRISLAAATPMRADKSSSAAGSGISPVDSPYTNIETDISQIADAAFPTYKCPTSTILRNVLMVMRQCIRTNEYIAFVQLGMKIVRDFCAVQECVMAVLEIEDSIDVISTCVQFYRDDEVIFGLGVDVLHLISCDERGIHELVARSEIISRLEKIGELVDEHLERSWRNNVRKLKAEKVLRALRKRKEAGKTQVSSLAQEVKQLESKIPRNESMVEALKKLNVVIQRCHAS